MAKARALPTSDDRTKALELAIQYAGTGGQNPAATFKNIEPLIENITNYIVYGYWK